MQLISDFERFKTGWKRRYELTMVSVVRMRNRDGSRWLEGCRGFLWCLNLEAFDNDTQGYVSKKSQDHVSPWRHSRQKNGKEEKRKTIWRVGGSTKKQACAWKKQFIVGVHMGKNNHVDVAWEGGADGFMSERERRDSVLLVFAWSSRGEYGEREREMRSVGALDANIVKGMCVKLDKQITPVDEFSTEEEIAANRKHVEDSNKVSCIMITAMSPELQKQFENMWAYEMNEQLAKLYRKRARQERFNIVKFLMACKMKEGSSVCTHVQTMKGYIDQLENFGGSKKRKRPNQKWKGKASAGPSHNGGGDNSSVPAVHDPKEAVCFSCKVKGHWKRSCPKYLQDLKDGKAVAAGSSSENLNLNIGSSNDVNKSCLWHYRLGHINKKRIAKLQSEGILESFDLKSDDVCEPCLLRKMTKSPFTGTCERGEDVLDLVYTDVCGPFRSPTRDGRHYYKSDTFEKFKEYRSEVENRLGKKIKVLRSDRGGEYLSIEFDDYLRDCGIVSQLTPPRTPQLNEVAERRNRTLLDMFRSMMSRASLPITFWGYALETVAHILNRVPTKKVSKTPFEMWSGKAPSLKHIKIWGCEAFVKRDTSDKLESRSERCQFFGYPQDSFGYLFYRPTENVVTSRVSQPPQFYGFHITAGGDTLIGDKTLVNLDEPANYKEAMTGPEAAQWKEAMDSEIQSMKDNQVWNLVEPTPGHKTVGCNWIFKKKTDMDGNVCTFKARLVAKGYTQTHGIDYDETFSPVAKIKSIRILLAIAAFHDYEIWQMDVKTAFLNEKLEEDVFMTQPEGFEHKKYPNKVCKLVKSIYGLKQASRSWNLCFHEKVKEKQCSQVAKCKVWLGKCFAMKDLGEAAYILGIRIYRDRSRRLIGLSQSTYVDKVLKRFNMENSKKGNVPIHHSVKLSKSQCPGSDQEQDQMSRVPYASAIGSIMYAMICTRPDVSYALSMVSRYQENPGLSHWTAVKNILKYLRNTKEMLLVYGGEQELKVRGYSDASFQTDRDDSKSQSGWEATWIKNFIGDLGVVPSNKDPIEIFCDNEGAVALTKEPRDHGRSRHIKRKYHYIRNVIEDGEIVVKRVSSEKNPADPFTKGLAFDRHSLHAKAIGMRNDRIEHWIPTLIESPHGFHIGDYEMWETVGYDVQALNHLKLITCPSGRLLDMVSKVST
ncbi:hypothetical protein LXL04_003333 [Taraxacum kok-saghyz]